MVETSRNPSSIPPPYRQIAKRFVATIHATDQAAVTHMNRAATLVKVRPTVQAMRTAARLWENSVPQRGCFLRSVTLDRLGLDIREIRLSSMRFSMMDWQTPLSERGVAIMRCRLQVNEAGFRFGETMLAYISDFAIARRFERGYGAAEAAVIDDMRPLIGAQKKLADKQYTLRVPVTGGGAWIGHPARNEHPAAGGSLFAAIRTFHAAKMKE